MKLIAPAQLADRLHDRGEQLDRLSRTIAETVAVWRARAYRHRIAIAVVGGGIAGMSLAIRGGSLVRGAVQLSGAIVRAAAMSAFTHARVRHAMARASRNNGMS
jgi:hypothetical protein